MTFRDSETARIANSSGRARMKTLGAEATVVIQKNTEALLAGLDHRPTAGERMAAELLCALPPFYGR